MTVDQTAGFRVVEQRLADTPVEWDSLVPPTAVGFFSSRTWNLAMSGQNDAGEQVLTAYDGRRPRAIVPVFTYDRGPANPHLHPGTLFGGATGVSDPTCAPWEPVTVVGSASGYGTAPAGDIAVWAATAEAAAERAEGTAFAAHLTSRDMARLRAELPDRPVLLTAVRTAIPITARSPEHHEASLRKRDRDRVRWERRLLVRGDRTIAVETLDDDTIDEIARLQEATQRHHGTYGDRRLFVDRYQRVKSVLGDDLVAFVCRHGGDAVGYFSCVVHGGLLIGRAAGLDYDRTGHHAEYFNLMVHEPVRYCIEHGLRELDLGIAGYRQKLLRGGLPEVLWSMLLRPPRHWTDRDTLDHNRGRAVELRTETGPVCPPGLAELLDRVADSGAAVL